MELKLIWEIIWGVAKIIISVLGIFSILVISLQVFYAKPYISEQINYDTTQRINLSFLQKIDKSFYEDIKIRFSFFDSEFPNFKFEEATIGRSWMFENHKYIIMYEDSFPELERMLWHEFGHFIWKYNLNPAQRGEWIGLHNNSARFVTNYASTDYTEDFSESFSVFMLDEDERRVFELSKEKEEFLEKNIGRYINKTYFRALPTKK